MCEANYKTNKTSNNITQLLPCPNVCSFLEMDFMAHIIVHARKNLSQVSH